MLFNQGMVSQRCLGQTEGELWDGVGCDRSGAAGEQCWDQVCQRTAALRHWNVGSFVFFKFTLVPCFGPAWCFPYPPRFLQGCVRANFNLRYQPGVPQSPSALALSSQVPAGLRLSWIPTLFPSLCP